MRQNRLKQLIKDGKTANGVLIGWPSPEMVEFFGHLGFDWAFIDAEHGYIDRKTFAEMARATDATGMTPVVRVPENNAATILGYLDAGALGIIVPHVSSGEAAQAAADAVRYAPRGHRGGISSSRPANYGLTQTSTEYFKAANEEIILIVMIEDVQGIQNIDEILAVEGVDAVIFGAGDLSLSMGYPGQPGHPEVQKLISQAREKVDKAKPAKLHDISATEFLRIGGKKFLAGEPL